MIEKFGCLIGALILLALYAVSYIITIGLIYLICMCFSLTFSWLIATGIWLVLVILAGVFK